MQAFELKLEGCYCGRGLVNQPKSKSNVASLYPIKEHFADKTSNLWMIIGVCKSLCTAFHLKDFVGAYMKYMRFHIRCTSAMRSASNVFSTKQSKCDITWIVLLKRKKKTIIWTEACEMHIRVQEKLTYGCIKRYLNINHIKQMLLTLVRRFYT